MKDLNSKEWSKNSNLLSLNLPEPSSTQLNSCAVLHCQLSFEKEWGNVHDSIVLKILKQMTEDKAYDQLRTRENLGYDVFTLVERIHGVLSAMVIVQSDSYDGEYLESRIQNFVKTHLKTLTSITKDEFTEYIENQLMKLKSPYSSLTDESSFYWDEITDRSLMFDRITRETKALEDVTLKDIVERWEVSMLGTNTRRCLSLMTEPMKYKDLRLDNEEKISETRDSLKSWGTAPMPPYEKQEALGMKTTRAINLDAVVNDNAAAATAAATAATADTVVDVSPTVTSTTKTATATDSDAFGDIITGSEQTTASTATKSTSTDLPTATAESSDTSTTASTATTAETSSSTLPTSNIGLLANAHIGNRI